MLHIHRIIADIMPKVSMLEAWRACDGVLEIIISSSKNP